MKLSRLRVSLLLLFVLSLFLIPTVTVAAPASQENTPTEMAADRLSRLTAEEKVGQLFMVEFEGSRVEEDSELYNLISDYHIGGVVLKRENNNFATAGDPMLNAWLLIQEIQRAEISNSRVRQLDPSTEELFSPALIPLFVGISQDGDGYPNDQILIDLSPLPNEMAIGATWNPALAFKTGEVLGKELSALGINMLFGPSLNINSNPRPELGGDLGTNSFGGSPYWVGEMGAQYIAGVHAGSSNQIAVISKQFPGNTGSDRPRAEEIPTIRRTLEQLTGFEFLPFFKVTAGAAAEEISTDGLLLSHTKYQAFQSNVTTATPPITLDAQAMEQLLSVSDFNNWYDQGGVIVSDELWNQAIRRFYEQQAADFRPALIARDALIAGNDILVLAGLNPNGDLDPFETIRTTLDFFAQKYREDQAFAQQVDDAVLRTLTLKYEIYPTFDSETILTSSTRLLDIGDNTDVAFDIARESATLIDPSRENLANVLPSAPTGTDQIVVISDGYSYQQCDACDTEFYPSVDAFQQAVLRLYGESGDGLISMWNISSFSTSNLLSALDYEGEDELPIFAEIRRARWVVFLFLDADVNRPESRAMIRFLSEMPDMLQDKKTVVFSFNSPYYLDANSISQVTAYYGLYSKQPQFFEIAARLLFQELNASGASPVSISGTGYLLEEALQPDSEQTLTLQLVLPSSEESGEAEETPEPIVFTQGDNIAVTTGVIMDNNGHPVVDNTLVSFSLVSTGTEGATSQREMAAYTSDGVARISHLLDTAGILEVTASIGDSVVVSNTLRLEVSPSGEGSGAGAGSLPTDTPLTTPVDSDNDGDDELHNATSLVDWLITLMVVVFISLFTYQLGAVAGNIRWAVRWGLTSFLGGLAANAYLTFGLPGSSDLILGYGIWGIVTTAAAGCLAGWLAGVVWRLITKNKNT